MNIQHKPGSLVPETVTTGTLPGSRKAYAAPKSHPDVRVPFREIVLSDPTEPALRVYDASGPYTEADARIDLAKGLPRIRDPWIARRGGLKPRMIFLRGRELASMYRPCYMDAQASAHRDGPR